VLASASISKLIPLSHVLTQSLDATPAEFALLLSLITQVLARGRASRDAAAAPVLN
jgi:hypothetical protein